jgi:hypothetical protein
MVMAERVGQVPPESNVDKTAEVARIIFHVDTPLTVIVASNGRWVLTNPGPATASNDRAPDIDTGNMIEALTEGLNGLVRDAAGKEFGVVRINMQASGSIEIVVIIVATYLAVKQGVEVAETLQKVAELGRRIVQAVMRAQGISFTEVQGRVDINPTMAATSRRTFAGRIGTNELLLLIILNLLITGAVLAVVLTR